MGSIINTTNFTQDQYDSYLDSTRALVDLFIDEDELPNEMIDNLVYMHVYEDNLMSNYGSLVYPTPGVINPDVNVLRDILRYIIYGTAIQLLYKIPQVSRETEEGESMQYTEIDFDKTLDSLRSVFNAAAVKLGIVESEDTTSTNTDPLVRSTPSMIEW